MGGGGVGVGDGRVHSGFVAPAGRGYGSETVHRVGVNCDDVEMVPIHRHSHKGRVCVLLCVTVLDVKASVFVVSCVGVNWVACAVVFFLLFFLFFFLHVLITKRPGSGK